MISTILFLLGNRASKRYLRLNYGAAFQRAFSHKAKVEFRCVNPCLPDIGSSVFRFNFAFTPAYIAWYRAALSLDVGQEETIRLIWKINELLIRLVPERLRAKYGAKFYLGASIREHVQTSKRAFPEIGHLPLNAVTPLMVDRLLEKMYEKGRSHNTVR